jgi:hypothetical protein
MDLSELRKRVLSEIDGYVYEYPIDTIGNPWSPEKVAKELALFWAALVPPYWALVVRDEIATGKMARCAIVADDADNSLLAFDPATDEFFLVQRRGDCLSDIGVAGDAVGCFMAR